MKRSAPLVANEAVPRFALAVVDAQFDYLDVAGVTPAMDSFVDRAANVLGAFRDSSLPIIHVRTLVRSDGTDAMRHRQAKPLCVDGTRGAEVPEKLAAHNWEPVIVKSHFSAFDNPQFEALLRQQGVTTLVIVGAYTHACVRETAIAAYRSGFAVVVVADAVVSTDPAHAASTVDWLNGRIADVLDSATVVKSITRGGRERDEVGECIVDAQSAPQSAVLTLDDRAAILHRWADRLESARARFARDISRAVRKPLVLADDEVTRAISHIRTAAELPQRGFVVEFEIAPGVTVRNEPVGVVALVMPWNNPLAIPAGKIAAAFLGGNSIVLKPSPLDGGVGTLLVAEARAAGVVGLEIAGNSDSVGRELAWRDDVDALAITGSIEVGTEVARACAVTGKSLQAELGGNNAAVVAPDADLNVVIPELVRNAFLYSGQRCTAIRRWIVHEDIVEDFIDRAVGEAERFASDPLLGELITAQSANRVSTAIDLAVARGAVVLAGGAAVRKRRNIAPTILRVSDNSSEIVQNELFGPVAVIQTAADIDTAISLANGVRHGLLAGVCSADPAIIERVTRESNAGIVQIGARPVPVHPDAPFGGWGLSGIGPAEHGIWDMQFFTRPRTVYTLTD